MIESAAKQRRGLSRKVLGIVPAAASDLEWTGNTRIAELLRFGNSRGQYYVAEDDLRELGKLGLRYEVAQTLAEHELPVVFSQRDRGAFEDAPPDCARLAVL